MSKTARKRRGKNTRKGQSQAKEKRSSKKTTKPDKWWQFKDGNCVNPAGGPKTARRVLNDDFIADLQEAWKTSGKALIERAIECYPDVFLYANAAIVPPELRSKINGLTDKDAVFGARMLAACADLKPLRETVCAEQTPENATPDPEWDQLALYRPYQKQIDFHNAGQEHDERLLMAGNQLGKTLAGGMEWAMHLTGRYPDWWTGKVFDKPVRLWAAGVTAESTRDNPQRVLMGAPQTKEAWGSGTIPKDAIKDWALGAPRRRCGRFGRGALGRRRRCGHGRERAVVQIVREGAREMAGRNARRGVVRRGAAAGHLLRGTDAHGGAARDRDRDVHAAAGHERGGEAVPRRGGFCAGSDGRVMPRGGRRRRTGAMLVGPISGVYRSAAISNQAPPGLAGASTSRWRGEWTAEQTGSFSALWLRWL